MKNPKKDLSLVSQIDWARLAAYIDGEGCIVVGIASHSAESVQHQRRPKNEFVRVAIVNTDLRLGIWLQETFGGALSIKTRQNPKHKEAFQWTVSCIIACDILKGCLPYFICKRSQAELALALQATMKKWGVNGVPQDVIEQRAAIRAKMHVLNKKGANEGAA